jgi:hypothetical protein
LALAILTAGILSRQAATTVLHIAPGVLQPDERPRVSVQFSGSLNPSRDSHPSFTQLRALPCDTIAWYGVPRFKESTT